MYLGPQPFNNALINAGISYFKTSLNRKTNSMLILGRSFEYETERFS